MAGWADGQQYERRTFARLTLPPGRLAGAAFVECTFERCTLAGCELYRCVFTTCTFRNCDLSVAKVPNSRFMGVRFVGCRLSGIDWTKLGDSDLSRLVTVLDFEECLLDYGSLFGLNLHGRAMTKCSAREVDLRDADVSGADLGGTDFSGALFHHTNLTGANLVGASNYEIDPRANTVIKARFSLPEAVSLLRGFDIVIE